VNTFRCPQGNQIILVEQRRRGPKNSYPPSKHSTIEAIHPDSIPPPHQQHRKAQTKRARPIPPYNQKYVSQDAIVNSKPKTMPSNDSIGGQNLKLSFIGPCISLMVSSQPVFKSCWGTNPNSLWMSWQSTAISKEARKSGIECLVLHYDLGSYAMRYHTCPK
jgi:hypothetical protein